MAKSTRIRWKLSASVLAKSSAEMQAYKFSVFDDSKSTKHNTPKYTDK